MRVRIGTGCLFALLILTAAAAGEPASPERVRRIAARAQREKVASGYVTARKNADSNFLNSLSQTIKWLLPLDGRKEAEKLLAEIRSVNPEYANLKDLEKLVAAASADKPLDDVKARELTNRVASAKRSRASDLISLARTCYDAGLMAYAYDLLWQALKNDPDNVLCRTAIGQQKSGNEWISRYAAKQLSSGNVYCPKVGWVPKNDLARYEKGEWCEGGKWMPMAEANKLHADLKNPWIIETENFTLNSTASREKAIEISERLEATRELCFREYLEYFMRGSKARAAQLLFNAPSDKKLLVYYFGKQADFLAGVPRSSGIIARSAGVYMPDQHASYFYYDPNFGPFQIIVMQHEVIHQILGEYARGGARAPWLTEGVASALEHGQLAGDGRLSLGTGYAHPDVASAARMLKQGKLPSITGLMSANHNAFHAEPGRAANYTASGALCRFLMDYKEGSYATDFLEYLYDCYAGRAAPLSTYINMEPAEIETAFKRYLEGYQPVAARSHDSGMEVAGNPKSSKSKSSDNPFESGGSGKDSPFVRREE
ncbi:MAG TPA: hypothetical protein VEK08_10545 [Planctomycetota bacterium]|nr:hypothetical protein [Planctomycetota bacterium]